jgi:hypothetical protein
MIYALWAFVILIGSAFLYLSGASMLGTFLKQRREADEQEARRMRWRAAMADDESTYGAVEGDFNAVLRGRAKDAP